MRDALKSYLALASGLADVPRQRAVAAAKALVSQGEATAEQVSTLAEELLAQSRSNREAVTALVKYEVDRTLGRLGLAANDEVTELTKRVRALEGQIRDLSAAADAPRGAAAASAPSSSPAAKKAPAKKAPARKAAVKAGRKTVKKAAKKAPARKAAVKAARKVAKKAPARKAAAKKAPARKAAVKAARKVAKKASVRKAAVKKAPAKKAAARKKASS